jgi:N-acetylglucosaminyl-diphospho-decaprenol L-rhamnosyltransferase
MEPPAMNPRSRPYSHDLAIIIVSANDVSWLEPCLRTVYAHVGDIRLDVVVVDNTAHQQARDFVETSFPQARVVTTENHGFGHANNRGALTCDARYILFLNPDTEIVTGTFGELVAAMDARPTVGLAGARQVTGDGELYPTVRYFPTVSRAIGEALGSERWPVRPRWSGERELNLTGYDSELECDWTTGAFMLIRSEALLSAGLLDERYFLYSEEPDLSQRIKRAGWDVRHLPTMTIIHHAGKAGVAPKMVAQSAFARRQYALKHFSRPYAAAYLAAYGAHHALRCLLASRAGDPARREAARSALRAVAGRSGSPYEPPPPTALRPAAD